MNFDDIKSAWSNDNDDNVVVPSSVDQLKTLQLPVEKLRSNMKIEFYVQLFSLILIGFLPRYTYFAPVLIIPFYVVYFVAVAISVYYFFKFHLFYKQLNTATLRSKDRLYALYYEAKLSIEMYKSYAYTLIPFALLEMAMHMASRQDSKMKAVFQAAVTNQAIAITMVSVFLTMLLLLMAITTFWVNSYYGKYMKQIGEVLEEFKEAA